MHQLEDWDDFVATRYQQGKAEEEFRNYQADANPGVTEFYRENHARQTYDFVLQKKSQYCNLTRGKKSIWEMAEYLNTLVDESDPDTDLTQIEHLLQTSEAIRKDGHPSWFVLAGFLHDLGKVLCLYGEPQWAVVGDTFPVGCAYSREIVFPEFSAESHNTRPSTASTNQTADSTTSISPSATTSTSTTSPVATFPKKPSTCSAITPFTPPIAMAPIAIS
jgi:inositol oxygenase